MKTGLKQIFLASAVMAAGLTVAAPVVAQDRDGERGMRFAGAHD